VGCLGHYATSCGGSNADEDHMFRSYVIGALQVDSTLPFEMRRLRKLVQMESGSWERHRAWILKIGKDVGIGTKS